MYYRPLSTVFFPLCKNSHTPQSHSRSPSTRMGKNKCSSACPRCMCHCVDKAHCDTATLSGHSSDLQTQSSTWHSYKWVWHETLTQQVYQITVITCKHKAAHNTVISVSGMKHWHSMSFRSQIWNRTRPSFFFHGALCPQKPYGLFGTGEEWDREWEPRPTTLCTHLLGSDSATEM